jgi:hypothetical protein
MIAATLRRRIRTGAPGRSPARDWRWPGYAGRGGAAAGGEARRRNIPGEATASSQPPAATLSAHPCRAGNRTRANVAGYWQHPARRRCSMRWLRALARPCSAGAMPCRPTAGLSATESRSSDAPSEQWEAPTGGKLACGAVGVLPVRRADADAGAAWGQYAGRCVTDGRRSRPARKCGRRTCA